MSSEVDSSKGRTSTVTGTEAGEDDAVIKSVDMSEEMQSVVIDLATQAMQKFNVEKDIAAFLKKEMDQRFGLTWHCIVGRNFGSYVTHETRHFIYFYIGSIAFMVFKTA